MEKRITLLDGAVGTRLWALADENGISREPVWVYNISHPELPAQVCGEYADAGAEILCANTFSVNRLAVEKVPGYTVDEVVRAAVRIARDTTAGSGKKVALDIGPLPEMLEPYGDLEEEDAAACFDEILRSGVEAGADIVFLETFMDAEMLRIAAREAKKYPLPVVCSMSFEKKGRTLMGNTVQDILALLTPLGVDAVGMNCSLGPEQAIPVIREFADQTDLPLFFKPNAGMPVRGQDGITMYDCGPERFAEEVKPALELVSYIGGCCGTDAGYIRRLKEIKTLYDKPLPVIQ